MPRVLLVSVVVLWLWPASVSAQSPRAQQVAEALALLAEVEKPLPQRAAPPPGVDSLAVLRTARQLGAWGGPLENPCRRWVGGTCVTTAMSSFFQSLDAQREKTAAHPTVVSVLGNSLIASDHITDVMRDRWVERFGDGGRGFILVDRMAPYGRRTRTGEAGPGFLPRTVAQVTLPPPPYPFSMSGVLHIVEKPARTEFALRGETEAVLHWLDHPGAGALTVRVNGVPQVVVSPGSERSATPVQRLTPLTLPPHTQTLELEADPHAVLYGISLQKTGPGLVLDTLGVPSVDASLFLSAPEELFQQAFSSRRPALVAFVLGGNETKRVAWGKSTLKKVEHGLRELIQRTRRAAPDSSCMVIGPIDSVQGGSKKGAGFVQRPELLVVNNLQRKVALTEGCAYFDMYRAMGGAGSLKKFHQLGLLHKDLVHPRSGGLDVLGELVVQAVYRAYEQTPVITDVAAVQKAWRTLARFERELPADVPTPWVVAGGGPVANSLFERLSQRLGAPAVSQWSVDGTRVSARQMQNAALVLFPLERLDAHNEAAVKSVLAQLAKKAPQARLLLLAPLAWEQEEWARRLVKDSRWTLLSTRSALGEPSEISPQQVSAVMLSGLIPLQAN